MGEIPAEYELSEPQKPGAKTSVALMAAIIAGVVAALCLALFSLVHADSAGKSQTAQIHALDKSEIRQSGEIAALKNQLAQMSGKLAAADPADDASLITCKDWRRLTVATSGSGSVSSVPGSVSVSLSQSRVPLPAHCPK